MKTLLCMLVLMSWTAFCSAPAVAACATGTRQWTGTAGDNSWATPSNWSGGTVPVSTDSVCIDSTFSANTITIPALNAANQSISKLTSGAPLSLTGGPLTISGTAAFTTLSVSGGTFTLNGTSTASILNLTGGTLSGTGALTVSGLTTWSNATMSGTGITNANGGISMPPAFPTQDTRTVNVGGTSTFGSSGGGAIYVMLNGATLNVKTAAVWNIVNDGTIQNNGGTTPVINNAGTFEKTAGTGTTNVGVTFNNNTGGTVTANSGTVSLNGGGSGTAAYSAGSGAKLEFGGGTFALNSGTVISGAGTAVFNATVNLNSGAKISSGMEVDGGTTTLTTGQINTVLSLTLNGGTLTGTDTLTVAGLTTWQNATMSGTGITNANGGISMPPAFQTQDTRTVNVGGTSTFGSSGGGANYVMLNGATLNVKTGAVWNIVNDGVVENNGGTTPVINNAGTFEKTAGTGTTNVGVTFNNNTGGTVTANSGTVSLNGGGSGTAAYSAGSGAKLQFGGGTFALNSGTVISGAGMAVFNATVNLNSGAKISSGMEVDGGTTTLTTGQTNTVLSLTLNGGTLTGPDTLSVTGLTTWANATMSGSGITNANSGISMPVAFQTQDTRTVNVGGTSTIGSSAGGPIFTLLNGATLNVQAGAVWNIVADGTIQNGSGTTPVINNAGTFEKTAGTGTATIGPTFNNNTGGAVTSNSGTLSFNGGGSGAGTYSIGSGAKLEFGGGTFALNNGTNITGLGTAVFNTTVNLNSGAKISSGMEVDGGTTTLTTGQSNTVLSLTLNGGTLTGPDTLGVTGLTTWQDGTMSGTGITNANGGISMPPAFPTLDTRTVNAGGTSTFGSGTSTPTFTMLNGATLNVKTGAVWNFVTDGTIQNGGGTTPLITNAGTFEKTAGTGTTTIAPNFSNSGALLAKSGTIGFSGAFTQTSGSTTLSGGSISGSVFNEQAGTFLGKGTITGNLSNTSALVDPGFSSPSVTTGILTLAGSGAYTQSAAGTLLLNVGGKSSSQFDQLNLSGVASLNGSLFLCIINNFQPAVGTKFNVMSYGSFSGQFSTVESGWTPTYNSTSLSVTYNGAAAVTFAPTNLSFPTQQVGTSTTMTDTLTNSGLLTLTISSIGVIGTNKSDFTITSNNCGSSLAVGASCQVSVKFTPKAAGKRNAQLSIVDSACGLPQIVNLSGSGTNVTLAPSPADFGSEVVGTTSAPLDITLTNNGTKAITVKSVSIAGTNAADFAIQNNTCSSVAAGGNCTITLTFTPQATGSRNATLSVSDTDGGSPQTDTLTGTGS